MENDQDFQCQSLAVTCTRPHTHTYTRPTRTKQEEPQQCLFLVDFCDAES